MNKGNHYNLIHEHYNTLLKTKRLQARQIANDFNCSNEKEQYNKNIDNIYEQYCNISI